MCPETTHQSGFIPGLLTTYLCAAVNALTATGTHLPALSWAGFPFRKPQTFLFWEKASPCAALAPRRRRGDLRPAAGGGSGARAAESGAGAGAGAASATGGSCRAPEGRAGPRGGSSRRRAGVPSAATSAFAIEIESVIREKYLPTWELLAKRKIPVYAVAGIWGMKRNRLTRQL